MTDEHIKWILDFVHNKSQDHKHEHFADSVGDPWGGYTRRGFEITYYPQTNTYTWEYLLDAEYGGIERDAPFEISEADLIERLRKDWYPYT